MEKKPDDTPTIENMKSKRGRPKSISPRGTKKPVVVMMHADHLETLARLGNGNRSKGLEIAMDRAAENNCNLYANNN